MAEASEDLFFLGKSLRKQIYERLGTNKCTHLSLEILKMIRSPENPDRKTKKKKLNKNHSNGRQIISPCAIEWPLPLLPLLVDDGGATDMIDDG